LARLATLFEQNLFEDTRARAVVLDSAAELEGCRGRCRRGRGERHRARFRRQIPAKPPAAVEPAAARLAGPALSTERLYAASVGRGEESNRELVVEMARLRAERAALLGYASHAAYEVEDQTAKSVEAVETMLRQLVQPAVANARREANLLHAAFEEDGHEPGSFAAWDWQYYAEKVRRREYEVDAAALRPYFELERVLRDGVFYAAGQVYGCGSWSGRTSSAITLMRGCLRCSTRTGKRSGCSSGFLRAGVEAGWRVDELPRPAVGAARHEAGGGQQPQHREAGRRLAGAADV